MKKIIILTTLLFTVVVTNAQDDNVSAIGVSLGASANYYYGPGDRNFGDYESERVNWKIDGMLGIALSHDKKGRRTMIAGFGALGFNNRSTISNILADQGYITTRPEQRSSNNFYTIEGGLLIAETFRISTGVGQQNFDPQAMVGPDGTIYLDKKALTFNSTTVGFQLNFTAVALTINCNIASGKDFEKTVLTPAAGLVIKL